VRFGRIDPFSIDVELAAVFHKFSFSEAGLVVRESDQPQSNR
jgi:hypothetical protein